MLILCITLIVVILVFMVLLWIFFRNFQKVRGCLLWVWRKIFWNFIIRSIFESSIGFLIGAMLRTS